MEHLEGSGTPVLYIERKVLKGLKNPPTYAQSPDSHYQPRLRLKPETLLN